MRSLPEIKVSERPEQKFAEFLALRGERFTKNRRELVRHIFSQHDHFTADDLVRDLEQRNIASRATVYRVLPLLVEAGLLRKHRFGDRDAYEHDYGYPEHDHLYCSQCKKILEFQEEELNEMLEQIARRHSFKPASHRLVITGVCAECNRKQSSRHKLDFV